MIEQVLMKKTLKAGKNIWEEGSVLNSPLPEDILLEVNLGRDTVEVLKGSNEDEPKKTIFVTKRVEEGTTSISQTKTRSGDVEHKPKLKFKRRKR